MLDFHEEDEKFQVSTYWQTNANFYRVVIVDANFYRVVKFSRPKISNFLDFHWKNSFCNCEKICEKAYLDSVSKIWATSVQFTYIYYI